MSNPSLAQLLSLTSPPVAIAFVDAAPAGVPHLSAGEPAGCGYWRRAAAGEVFYTVADDHKRCPVGAYTEAARRRRSARGGADSPPADFESAIASIVVSVIVSYVSLKQR